MLGALVNAPVAADNIGEFFHRKTCQLITSNSYTLVGGQTHNIDVVRDVLNHVPLYWAATEIVSDTPR
jgi:hypothetical protein